MQPVGYDEEKVCWESGLLPHLRKKNMELLESLTADSGPHASASAADELFPMSSGDSGEHGAAHLRPSVSTGRLAGTDSSVNLAAC